MTREREREVAGNGKTFTGKSRASSGGEAGGVKITVTCAALSSKEKQKRIKGKCVVCFSSFSPGLRESGE